MVLLGFVTLAGPGLLGYAYAGGHSSRSSIYPWPPLNEVHVRLSPTISSNSSSAHDSPPWIPPPVGFHYGHWWVTHSSDPAYLVVYNIQGDSYPPIPPSYPGLDSVHNVTFNASAPPTVDITSWSPAPNASDPSVVVTVFGYDFPRQGLEGVFDFHATSKQGAATPGNSWEILAWGYDSTDAAYALLHETAIPGMQPVGLTLECRVKGGPDTRTIAALVEQLKGLGNDQLATLADELVVLPMDERRDGKPPVECPESCIYNENIPAQ